MRHTGLAFALLTLLLAAAPLPARAASDETARLAAGERIVSVVPLGPGVDRARVAGVLDAPLAQVRPVIEDCGRYAATLPGVIASKELSREGDVRICQATVGAPWPIGDLTSVERARGAGDGQGWRRDWTLVEGDYTHLVGSWTLTPYGPDGAKTLGVYQVEIGFDAAIPGWLRRWMQQSQMPRLLDAVERAARAPAAQSSSSAASSRTSVASGTPASAR